MSPASSVESAIVSEARSARQDVIQCRRRPSRSTAGAQMNLSDHGSVIAVTSATCSRLAPMVRR